MSGWILVLWLGLVFGSIGALSFGLAGTLAFGLGLGLDRITPAEALRWSWRKARRYGFRVLVVGLGLGLIGGLGSALGFWLVGGPVSMLASGPGSNCWAAGCFSGCCSGCFSG